jgi:hypothetical protein
MRCTMHMWKDRVDRVRKALQIVNHGYENVADAPGPQFIHDPQPEFGAFGGFDPQAQNVLCSIRSDAERDIDGLVALSAPVSGLRREDCVDVCARDDGSRDSRPSPRSLRSGSLARSRDCLACPRLAHLELRSRMRVASPLASSAL